MYIMYMTIMLTDMLAEILASPTPRLSLKQRGGVGKEIGFACGELGKGSTMYSSACPPRTTVRKMMTIVNSRSSSHCRVGLLAANAAPHAQHSSDDKHVPHAVEALHQARAQTARSLASGGGRQQSQ